MNLLHWFKHSILRQPSCQDVNRFLVEYLDGSLDSKTQSRYEAHLGHCPPCAKFFDQYNATIEMARECDHVKVPDQLAEHTLEFLRAQGRAKQ